MYAQKSVKC